MGFPGKTHLLQTALLVLTLILSGVFEGLNDLYGFLHRKLCMQQILPGRVPRPVLPQVCIAE